VRIIADTNLLVRLITGDDETQAALALERVTQAELVAVGPTVLCELAWVLRRGYAMPPADIAAAIRQLIATRNVTVDRPAVEAGLAILDAGGDFADGVIAHQGRWLGGETFLSFDRKAVRLLADTGLTTHLLA
jgi:predicted nucleic-acid-binding protein